VPHVVCLVTTPTANGREIARAVVEARLAACVNIVPRVESIYRWEGKIEADEESLLVIKTTRAAVEPLTAAIRAVHPYENFELVALDIAGGSPLYLDWIAESVRS
jgi:periplasmic divalent cation tolerance protein